MLKFVNGAFTWISPGVGLGVGITSYNVRAHIYALVDKVIYTCYNGLVQQRKVNLMPRRKPANRDEVLRVYAETKSGRETARILNLHSNTVYQILRAERGQCERCSNSAAAGKKHCSDCLKVLAQEAKKKRAIRRANGICVNCDSPRVKGSSYYCEEHWQANRARQKRYKAKLRGTKAGLSNEEQRIRSIKDAYGAGGIEAWVRDGGRCIICQAEHTGTNGSTTVHLHHIDEDRSNNVPDNFACLCFDDHHLVTKLLGLSQATDVILWVAQTYPDFKEKLIRSISPII